MHTVKFDIIKLTIEAVYTFSEFKKVKGNIKLGKAKTYCECEICRCFLPSSGDMG